jgi:hypothetical protein
LLDELFTIEELVDELMEEDLELDVAELTRLDELLLLKLVLTFELVETLDWLKLLFDDPIDEEVPTEENVVCKLLDRTLEEFGVSEPDPPPPQPVKIKSDNIQYNFTFIL